MLVPNGGADGIGTLYEANWTFDGCCNCAAATG
jgi:hypothetical protein